MTTIKVEIPPKLIPVFRGKRRYRGAYGGRGSAKTRTFALMTAIRAYEMSENGQSGVILCAREFMNSLADSSMEEVKQAIQSSGWLADYFDIGEQYIRTKNRLVSYSFCGLRHNLDSIKSKARILIAWVDEAENVSEKAWRKLIPTVREADSEIWVTWNPEKRDSPTDLRFRKTKPTNSKIVEINYNDNPWFPKELNQERIDDKERLDSATYNHIWKGDYLENSDAQIFANKFIVDDFEITPEMGMPFCGLDFGFSKDPTAATMSWIYQDCLYIGYEAGKVGLELDDTANYILARCPDFDKYDIVADSARPESISYLKKPRPEKPEQKHLPKIVGAKKGQGSIEDGISFIKSFKRIIIHQRCKETANEFKLYSYKIDQHDRVTTDIVDAYNHYIDSLRYALERAKRKRGFFS